MFDRATFGSVKIVNRTCMPVRFLSAEVAPLPSEGQIVCAEARNHAGYLRVEGQDIEEIELIFGDAADLPPPAAYTIFLASRLVCIAAAGVGRFDFRYPIGENLSDGTMLVHRLGVVLQ